MKKAYSKPEIYIEDFTLSETIASDCTRVTHSHYKSSCTFTDGKYVLFFKGGSCKNDPAHGQVALNPNKPIGSQYHCTNGPAAGMVFSS